MTQYFGIKDSRFLVKTNSKDGDLVQTIEAMSYIIDYVYKIDEDGELLTEENTMLFVTKGDTVFRLYGRIVDGEYDSNGRTYMTVPSNRLCDMSPLTELINARIEHAKRENEKYNVMDEIGDSACSDTKCTTLRYNNN